MDIAFSPEELAFRDEVRAFFDDQFDDEVVARLRSENFKEAIVEWQQRLYKKGWIAANWPVEYGGTGWTPTQKYIYETERSERGIPGVIPFGIGMVGPMIYQFGTPEQKEKFLPAWKLRRPC